ncbi:intracellular coagulation inhibitor 2 [Tachypleus tridentatus]|uniref:intracellular coagulation inhibitor 2 n=1 Tax=Tachypleus tridentatus TaxID=6853 RepID=UPI003FD28467
MLSRRTLDFCLVMLIVSTTFCQELHFYKEKADRSHENLKTAVNQFGIHLCRRLLNEGKNIIFSPFSLSTALSMAFVGARGNTAIEMSSVLGFREAGLAQEDVPDSFYQAFQLLKSDQSGDKFYVANTALVQNNYNILNSYKRILHRKFYSDIQPVDFVRNGIWVKEMVNKWVSNITHNKITSLIDKPLSPLTRLFLLNAVYFKGSWKTQFDRKRTTLSLFYNNNKVARRVEMMSLTNKFPYTYDSELKCQVLELPYDGDKTSMIFILPEWDVRLKHVENALSAQSVKQLINNLQDTEIVVTIPKFKLENSPQIKEYLQVMGMNEAFSFSADFSGMNGRRNLFVKDVLHKAMIDVNEEGSEAAAASGVVVMLKSASHNLPTFVANHPFMFLIINKESGMILFLGSVREL